MKSPCYQCPDRWVTDDSRCHSTCTRYAEFLAEKETRNMVRYTEKGKGYQIDTFFVARNDRIRKKKGRK